MKRIYLTSSRRAPEAPSLGSGATFAQLMSAANTLGTGKWHILEYEFDAEK
jgi:hypothetical protein